MNFSKGWREINEENKGFKERQTEEMKKENFIVLVAFVLGIGVVGYFAWVIGSAFVK